jgi:acyl carrier protein
MSPDTSPPLAELDRAAILARVKEQLVRLLNLESTDSMDESTELAKDLGVDSLGMVDLVIVMEESFQVKMASDTDLTSVRTIGDMTDLLLGMK